jgi:hypothetical protein
VSGKGAMCVQLNLVSLLYISYAKLGKAISMASRAQFSEIRLRRAVDFRPGRGFSVPIDDPNSKPSGRPVLPVHHEARLRRFRGAGPRPAGSNRHRASRPSGKQAPRSFAVFTYNDKLA